MVNAKKYANKWKKSGLKKVNGSHPDNEGEGDDATALEIEEECDYIDPDELLNGLVGPVWVEERENGEKEKIVRMWEWKNAKVKEFQEYEILMTKMPAVLLWENERMMSEGMSRELTRLRNLAL